MLYAEAKKYLLDRLKEAGVKSKPHTTRKSLERSQDSHVGAVLFESEDIARNGSKHDTVTKQERRKRGARFLTGGSPSL